MSRSEFLNGEDRSLPVIQDDPRDWEVRVCVTLLRFHSRLERRMAETLGAHGLTLPQFDVLMTLMHGEGITQQDLAEHLLVTKGNVVGLIDRVSASGWVERRPDPEDRRANRLYLTDAGRKIVETAAPASHVMMKKVFGQLTEGELRLTFELLERLDQASQDCGPLTT